MTNASAPPLEGRCRSHDLQRAGVVLDGTHGYSTAADHLGAAVVPEPALESLHIEQAGEALVRCPAHPLAVGLHQGSHEFINSFQVRRGGGALSYGLHSRQLLLTRVRGRAWSERAQGLNC